MSEKITDTFDTTADLDKAIDTEIKKLKAEGFSKAAICERSFEIEDTAKANLLKLRPAF